MENNIRSLLINKNATLHQTLEIIENNHLGIAIVIEDNSRVIGTCTDGDIRRKLIDGSDLSEKVGEVCNKKFISANQHTPRELILKQLDQKIRLIPILNEQGELIEIVTNQYFPPPQEQDVLCRSRAPIRVSFAGGGSDLTYFFQNNRGAVLNTALCLYSHATMRLKRDTQSITIVSADLKDTLYGKNLDQILKPNKKFKLIQSVLAVLKPNFGFDLFIHSDFPMNSGLGGSAAIVGSILGCFNEIRKDKWTNREIAELAFQIERLQLRLNGGWQDQYATIFGGFNFMEFGWDENVITPLKIDRDILNELEANLLLCNTNIQHDSSKIHKEQKEVMQDIQKKEYVKENVEICYKMKNRLLSGSLESFGDLLNQAWQLKKHFAPAISSKQLDNIYDTAIANGAIGGKLLGAGAGGFFLFYCPPEKKMNLTQKLEKFGCTFTPLKFEKSGMISWKAREYK